jgi:hypothetical protein
MPDKLQELFDAFKLTTKRPTPLQLFQGGLTVGASTMRQRAVSIISAATMDNDAKNALLNAVGSLSDIP